MPCRGPESGSIDGYDPATGELLWTLEDEVGGNRATTPLAVANGRFVMAASPGMHNENEGEARRTNGIVSIEKSGEGYKAKVLWRTEEAMPAFNTPTISGGLAYWVNKAGVVFCYNAETGEKHYSRRIDQGCWATPVAIGDRLYVFGKDGLTTVLAAGPEFNVISKNQLWDPSELPSESLARNRAAGRDEDASREPAEGHNDESSSGGNPSRRPESGGRPEGAGRPEGGARRGGPPGAGGNYDAQTIAQGENRFADPVQYGVAIVNGSIVIRTGEMVYCVRGQ